MFCVMHIMAFAFNLFGKGKEKNSTAGGMRGCRFQDWQTRNPLNGGRLVAVVGAQRVYNSNRIKRKEKKDADIYRPLCIAIYPKHNLI